MKLCWSIVYTEGSQAVISKKYFFLYAAFYLGLHCLQKYFFYFGGGGGGSSLEWIKHLCLFNTFSVSFSLIQSR